MTDNDDLNYGETLRGLRKGMTICDGRYELIRKLGRGGMGEVWLGKDHTLGLEIALKFLPELLRSDEKAVDDLKRETRKALQLTHSNIVRVYDFFEDAQFAGISMEYVDGKTLAGLSIEKEQRCFEFSELKKWISQLCSALSYAHDKAKIVHRDLKPANLMIDSAGDMKVADFGISASITDSVSRVSVQASSSGTPVYMSPQQMMGDDPSVWDDIYSFGATLYELLTAKPPFYSGNILLQVQSKVPPSIQDRRAALGVTGSPVPESVETVVAACLAKEVGDRPVDVRALEVRLQGIARHPSVEVPAPSRIAEPDKEKVAVPESPITATSASTTNGPPKSKRLWIGLFALVVVVLGGGYYIGIYQPEQARRAELALVEKEAETAALRAEAEARRAEEVSLRIKGDEVTEERLSLDNVDGPVVGRSWVVPDLGIELLWIQPGEFVMGSPVSEEGRDDDEKQHRVRISRGYWLGKYEVTQGEWEAVMGSNPSWFKESGRDAPVDTVHWGEAMLFCEKLTERERRAGRLPSNFEYSLPTEAEWEFACRAGTTGPYAGLSLNVMGWYVDNSGRTTHPVGRKQPNGWGLYDMHGNVSEWCLERYEEHPSGNIYVPEGPATGTFGVYRGGNLDSYSKECRSANRSKGQHGVVPSGTLGFRLAIRSIR